MKYRSFILFGLLCLICLISGCSAVEPGSETPMKTPIITPTPILTQDEIQVTPSENPDNSSEPLVVPLGQPGVLDGSISSGEWDAALIEKFADASELLLMQDGEFLYVGIRNNETGSFASNVFIQIGDEISILHSSAALGTAIYQKGSDGWMLTRNFSWRCRDTGNSEAAQTERAEFFQDEGWLASNGRMGTPGELEYKILIPDQGFRIAAVYIKSTPPYEKVPWPASLEDDSVKSTPDGLPDILYFSPDHWITFEMPH